MRYIDEFRVPAAATISASRSLTAPGTVLCLATGLRRRFLVDAEVVFVIRLRQCQPEARRRR